MRRALLLALVAACNVPDRDFAGLVDGNGMGGPDSSGVQMIVVQPTSLTVPEGMTAMFAVTLSQQPPETLLIDVASSDEMKLKVSPSSLLFGKTDWSSPKMVMVSGQQDPDTSDETVTVSLKPQSSLVMATSAAITVVDNDKLNLVVSPMTLDVSENASAPLRMHLSAQPSSDVVIAAASDNTAAATVDPAMVTFTMANWDVDQAVTVSGIHDANAATDTANLLLTSPALSTIQVPLTVTDIDVLGIAPSSTTLALTEGNTMTFNVMLTQQPTTDTTVTIASAKVAAVTAAPASLVFTSANWSTPRQVTVTAVQDPDTQDEAVALTLSAAGLTSRTVAVSVTDEDVQSIVATPATVALAENGSSMVGVHLAFKPQADVMIDVSSLSTTVATATPAMLVFSPSSYQTDQQITVQAPDDLDAAAGSTTLRLQSVTEGLLTDVPVAVSDDDTLAITPSATTVALSEGAATSFTVKLSAQPLSTTAVTVTPADPAKLAVTPASISFTSANWNMPQTIMVTSLGDPDQMDEHVAISLAATGMPTVTVTANVTDTTQQSIVASPTSVMVTEGSTGTFSVTLTAIPSGNVTVNVASLDAAIATVSPATLTFTPSSYATPQIVQVAGAIDADAVDETTTVNLSSPGLPTVGVPATIKDTDHLAIETNPSSISLGEGASGAVSIRLTAQPTATTTIMLVTDQPTKAAVSPTMLTFTTTNWSTFQTATLTGQQDADANDESVVLTASASGLASVDVPVTVIDDEIQGIVADAASVTVAEGGTATVHVHLAAAPSANTTVSIASSNPAAATAAPPTLTFTPTNYGVDQTVTITGIQDVNLTDETATLMLAASGLPSKLVGITVTDDDTQVVVAGSANVTVAEGQMTTVGISLGFQPATNVVVSISSADPAIATATPTSLTFTPANYAMAQTVTVAGVHDANAVTSTTSLVAAATGATSATVGVSVTDIDTLALDVTSTTVAVTEGATATFGVRLTAQPQGNVSVTLASSNTAKATAAPSPLTFTPTNWDAYQTVTVTGVQDADAVDANVTVTVASTGLSSVPVAVTVSDDDTVAIVTDATAVTMSEGGTKAFHVALAAQPQTSVTVSIASADTSIATVSPSTLTFTTSNWNTNQTVTVTGVHDINVGDDTVAINLTAAGLAAQSVSATVTDIDTEQILAASSTVSVNESSSTTVGVTLRYIPTGNVTVDVASSDTNIASVSPATLTFTPTTYNVPQNVTITGVKDADAATNNATISLTSSGVTSASIAVTVNDTDTLAIQSDTTSLAITEGATGTFGVRLSAQPLVNTTLTLSSSNGAAATASPGSLTFTPLNWNTYQTITVTGVQDANLADETAMIHFAGGGLTFDQPVSVTDDDMQTLIVSSNSVLTSEGQSTTFTVKLGFVPPTTTTVSVTSNNTAIATVSPATLSFTSSNYSTAQTVTVTGVHDSNTVNDTTTISVTAAGAAPATVTANVTDIDVLGMATDMSSVTTTETTSTSFGVKLTAQPSTNVVVSVASLNAMVATASPTTLTFTPTNWSTFQSVTVSGAHDANLVADTTSIKLSATGLADVLEPVTVNDVDTQSIVASTSALTVGETQNTTFTVKLAFVPTSPTTVSIASGNTGVATTTPTTLMFTSTNYNMPQTVTVTGVHDADAVQSATTLQLTAPGANSASVTVTVTDIDTLGIATNTSAVTVNEGNTTQFGVTLTAQPQTNVTVSVASSNGGVATVSPASLTFTPTNWNQAQNVTVTGTHDPNLTNDSASVTVSATGLTTQTVAVTVNDIDTQAVVVNASSVTINENGTSTVKVNLQYQPATNVTVTVASGDTGIATASPTTLTFTPTNYNVQQNVTITGTHDADVVDSSTVINYTLAGATSGQTNVTVHDIDTMALVVDAATMSIAEGGSSTFHVKLSNQPQGNTTVTVATDNGAATSVSPTSLTFTTANWSTNQTVTVSTVHDVNLTNEAATITVSSAPLAAKTVAVTVVDVDQQAVVFTPTSTAITEGASGSAQVKLAFQPSTNVTVSIGSSSTNLSVSPSSLVFTPGNYNQPQTISFSAVGNDGDSVNNSYTITGSASGATSATLSVYVYDVDTITYGGEDFTGLCGGNFSLDTGIALTDVPSGPVTITITKSGNAINTFTPTTMTFTPSNWNVPQNLHFTTFGITTTCKSGSLILSAPGMSSRTILVLECPPTSC